MVVVVVTTAAAAADVAIDFFLLLLLLSSTLRHPRRHVRDATAPFLLFFQRLGQHVVSSRGEEGSSFVDGGPS